MGDNYNPGFELYKSLRNVLDGWPSSAGFDALINVVADVIIQHEKHGHDPDELVGAFTRELARAVHCKQTEAA